MTGAVTGADCSPRLFPGKRQDFYKRNGEADAPSEFFDRGFREVFLFGDAEDAGNTTAPFLDQLQFAKHAGDDGIPDLGDALLDVLGRGLFHRPAKDAKFLAERRVHGHGLGRVLLEFGARKSVGAEAAAGLFPEGGDKCQAAQTVNQHPQRWIGNGWQGDRISFGHCAKSVSAVF